MGDKKNEAFRRRHLFPEIIHWSIQSRARKLKCGQRVKAGMVICTNTWGGQWAMSPTEFDEIYKTR